jgi:SAM-dependent methyltransferase
VPVSVAGNEAYPADKLLRQWRADLEAWAIPEHITAAVSESPWVLPRQVFARRADRLAAAPGGPSYRRAWAALDPPGSVLDIGSGAGSACLPLLPRCTDLTAVDTEADMLELLGSRVERAGMRARLVRGPWPAVADAAGQADVVTCHHVTYNVQDIAPFLAALTSAARRLVIVEMTLTHPLTSLNDLWLKFHGLRRPDGPTAADLVAILAALGIDAGHETWRRPSGADYANFAELVEVTRRRLCLPPDRAGDVGRALRDAGINPDHPADLGSSGREVVTIWWDGRADT